MSDVWKELENEIAKLLFKYGFTVDQCLKYSHKLINMLKRENK